MKLFFYIIAVYALIIFAGNALAADLQVGEKITINGTLNFNGTDYTTLVSGGSAGTIVIGSVSTLPAGSNATVTNSGTSTAAILNFGIPAGATGATGATGQAGQSITGPQGPQGEQGIQGDKGASFVLHSTTLSNDPNYSGAWVKNITTWTPLNIPYSFDVTSDNSYIRVTWTDNVGIYGPNWCNIGLFIDGNTSVSPACTGAFSGVTNTTIFNQQTLVCILPPLSVGTHTIGVYHRSQYCYYGFTAFDTDGGMRKLNVEVLQ